jgi:hypothetical protein
MILTIHQRNSVTASSATTRRILPIMRRLLAFHKEKPWQKTNFRTKSCKIEIYFGL